MNAGLIGRLCPFRQGRLFWQKRWLGPFTEVDQTAFCVAGGRQRGDRRRPTAARALRDMGKHGAKGESRSYERRAWTRKEDDAIIRLVDEYGTKRWSVISDHLNGENHGTERTGKQCRTR